MLYELESELAATIKERHDNIENVTGKQNNKYRKKIRELRSKIQAILTDGANPCSECGQHPLGIHQPHCYEVRCLTLTCRKLEPGGPDIGRRSRGETIAQAVENWNEERFFMR